MTFPRLLKAYAGTAGQEQRADAESRRPLGERKRRKARRKRKNLLSLTW